jgi:hypothetical protein
MTTLDALIDGLKKTSSQLRNSAEVRTKEFGDTDELAWQHRYQAMYFGMLAENLKD